MIFKEFDTDLFSLESPNRGIMILSCISEKNGITPCEEHRDCIDKAMEIAEQTCSEKQIKFTNLRRKILRMIWEGHGPKKAYDLLSQLQLTNQSAKPATVYRTLEFLIENGFVHKVNSLNAFVGCSHPLKHQDLSLIHISEPTRPY